MYVGKVGGTRVYILPIMYALFFFFFFFSYPFQTDANANGARGLVR